MGALAIVLACGLWAAEAGAATLAVMPARLDEAARAQLTGVFDDVLLAAAQRASGHEVIGRADLQALLDLETQRRDLGCDDACLAELIGGLGIDRELIVRVVQVEGGAWLAVGKLVDPRAMRVEAVGSVLVPGGPRDLLMALPGVVGDLLASDPPPRVVAPSPFGDRLARVGPLGGARRCRPGDPVDCEEQCLRRDAASCQELGTMYLMGRGLPAVWGRSAIFFEQACDLGSASGCNNLGVLHHLGWGVKEDEARARALFELACDGGDGAGCQHLGALLAARP